MVAASSASWASASNPIQSDVMVVTPAMARHWLEALNYHHQRGVSSHTVAHYAAQMSNGQWIDGGSIKFVVFRGAKHLVNGQHRLAAQVKADMTICYVVTEHEVQSNEEIALLYGHEDIGRSRTFADMHKALELPEQLGMSATSLNETAAAAALLGVGILREKGLMTRYESLRLTQLYAPYARIYFDLIVGSPKYMTQALHRRATLSVALLSFRYTDQTSEALALRVRDFWQGVATDDRIGATDPRKYAHRHLIETSAHRVLGSSTLKSTSTLYSARFLVQCFNAFMDRREYRGSPKVVDPSAPINMRGVPINHKEWAV